MSPPSVVLDTNVVVSAHLSPHGLERFVLDLAVTGKPALCYSDSILAEYKDVLSRPRFSISAARLADSLTLIRETGKRVVPIRQPQIALDPGDNIFLECAEKADAQYLVTGNKKHFPAMLKATLLLNARELIETVIPDLKR